MFYDILFYAGMLILGYVIGAAIFDATHPRPRP